MNIKFLLPIIIFFTISTFGQEGIASPDKKAKLNSVNWDFICDNYALTGIAKVQITKTDKGGTITLTVETTNVSYAISGNIYVDLADNTVLPCIDRNNRYVNGNEISSTYNFSTIEMNKLKITDITTIRFNIEGKNNGFGSQTGFFTAVNRKNYFSTAYDKSKKGFDTAKEITALYAK